MYLFTCKEDDIILGLLLGNSDGARGGVEVLLSSVPVPKQLP